MSILDLIPRALLGFVVGAALGSAIITAYVVTQRGVACYEPALSLQHLHPTPEQSI